MSLILSLSKDAGEGDQVALATWWVRGRANFAAGYPSFVMARLDRAIQPARLRAVAHVKERALSAVVTDKMSY